MKAQPKHRAYRYRFYPTQAQAGLLTKTFGCTRFVYNWGLALRTAQYKEREAHKVELGPNLPGPSYKRSSAELTKLKKDSEYAWLKESLRFRFSKR